MQPVQVRAQSARDVATAAQVWDRVVDSEVAFVWEAALDAGLGEEDAALVSQLTWLRLAQRWPTAYPGLTAVDAGGAAAVELRRWLEQTVRVEARALLRTAPSDPMPEVTRGSHVVCLSPGVAPPEPRSRRH